MKYFTDNPLERQMMCPPASRVKHDPSPPISKGHPCFACKRWGGRETMSCTATGVWSGCCIDESNVVQAKEKLDGPGYFKAAQSSGAILIFPVRPAILVCPR